MLQLGAPIPTYLYYTGRGYNAVYKLDKSMNLSLQEVVERRKAIITALISAWSDACADSHCTDVTRLTRMQSSINPKTGNAADIVRFDKEGKVYTLEELENLLGLDKQATIMDIEKTEKVKREKTEVKKEQAIQYANPPINTIWIWQDIIVPNKENLFTKRLRGKLSDMETLLRLRNGDMTHCRNYFLHFAACISKYLEITKIEAEEYLHRLAAVMTSREKNDDIRIAIPAIINSAYSGRYNYSIERMIKELNVTPEEQRYM